jgi:ATP-dependent Clp protease ATP-binding subunit ClpC
MRKKLMDQLKRQFRPEFINRVDSIVVFRQLSQEDIRQIVDIILGEVNDRLVDHELKIEATAAGKDWLGEHGYDPEFGARPLRRLIQNEVEDRLSDAVLSGKFGKGDTILLDVAEDEIVLKKASSSEDEGEVTEEAFPA